MITNRSGASVADVELITSVMNRSKTELRPDYVVVHLGTNDIMYKKTSAPLVIVKYNVALDNLDNNTHYTRSEHLIKYKWKSDSVALF